MNYARSRLAASFSHIRVRVTLAAASVTLLGGVVGAGLFIGFLHENLERALLSSARQQAGNVDARLSAGSTAKDAVLSGRDDLVIQIIDGSGRVIATDHSKVTDPILTRPGRTEGARVATVDDTFAAVGSKASTGDGLIVVGVSEEQVARVLQVASVLLMAGVPVSVALLAAVVWFSIGRALRPVEVMRREAAAITSEDLHRRLALPPGDDEIPRLATTLNEMLERLDTSQRQQRQFVSDASHELRSPLASVRQMAEVAFRHSDQTTVGELASGVLAEELRMEQLVSALLTLARLDDRTSLRVSLVDLDDIVLQEVSRLRSAGGPTINVGKVSGGQVVGDSVLFGQVVRNLLSNAVRHARSAINVSLQETLDATRLIVEDDGSGIPPSERLRVFERFTRLDEARSRDSGGAGLGLSIVRSVVEAAHGTVTIEDVAGGGSRFTVTLPANHQTGC